MPWGWIPPGIKSLFLSLELFYLPLRGFFMTHYNGGIGPSEAGVSKSVRYVSIVAVGGMANIGGTLVMGTLLNFLSLRGVFGHFDDAVFGIILVVIMLFFPGGFVQKEFFSEVYKKIKKIIFIKSRSGRVK